MSLFYQLFCGNDYIETSVDNLIEMHQLITNHQTLNDRRVFECISRIEKLEEKININGVCIMKEENKTFDFMTAVKYMKEGKKVRIKNWDKNNYIYKFGCSICEEDGSLFHPFFELFESNDWEIYEGEQ